ncbi:MAG: DNA-directed RNA polymerase subunit beta, partial [Clostridia bacterium]|nr:DNA-directed RNA polymerase subunit beta [Clostridia bacterium]
MPNPIKVGRKERMTFAKIAEDFDKMPNLIDIQTSSYKWFIEKGLKEAFDDISPIRDYANKLSLDFIDYHVAENPKYTQEECKERDTTYAAPLKVTARLRNNETGEVKESEVFMCEFPIMTEKGTFIYNGAERAVVTQLVRSPGAYFANTEKDKTGKTLFTSQVIPNRGAWIEYEAETGDTVAVRLDRNRKQPLTVFLRALASPEGKREEARKANSWWGLKKALVEGTNQEIINLFDADPVIVKTLEKDKESHDYATGIQEIYRKLRPTEPASLESAMSLFNSIFFDDRRYDLEKVGRFKYNQKLGLLDRIAGEKAGEDVIDPNTGEILVEEGQIIDTETAETIQNAGVFAVTVYSPDPDKTHEKTKVIGNGFVNVEYFIANYYNEYKSVDLKKAGIAGEAYYPVLKELLEAAVKNGFEAKDLQSILSDNKSELSPKYILPQDVVASVSYFLNLYYSVGRVDDIDNLGNRRLRTVGELLQNQFRIGLSRMEKIVKEKMTAQDVEMATPQQLINSRPVISAVKEFFGSSQLSQFMDQNNPLAELTHKRRLSALGPGGLSRDRAGFDVRDIHYTHYGRMCPIETPEGPNIGLIGSITTYGKVNEYGFIETPYRVVKHKTVNGKTETIVTDEIQYLPAWREDEIYYDKDGNKKQCVIAQANEPLDKDGHFLNEKVLSRRLHGEIALSLREEVDFMDVSPKQVVSVAAAMIPFLENDDANRALMGSNMQRQAVPLLVTEAPFVATGIEYKAACDSGVVVLAK